MTNTRTYYSRLTRTALGLMLFAGVASAQLIGFSVKILNDTGQNAYRVRLYTENPIASTAFGLPLNNYMVDVLDGTPPQNIVEFYMSLPVLKNKPQTIVWLVERSLPANINAYQWLNKDGSAPIGPMVYGLRFQTDSTGLVSILNPGTTPITYTSLKLSTKGFTLLAPASATVDPGNPLPVVAIGDATNVSLTFTDPRCGAVYYHRAE